MLGYIYLIISTMMWSFVGFLVKTASFSFDSYTISFARFFLGVIIIIIYAKLSRTKISWNFTSRLIWLGAVGKGINYLCENIAISLGYSYSNIIVLPMQMIVLALISLFIFKQALRGVEWLAITLCLIGMLLVQWNGVSMTELFTKWHILVLLMISGIGGGMHVLSQKRLTAVMDPSSMNASTFFLAAWLVFIPVPSQFEAGPTISVMAVMALFALGIITAMSFHLFAKALQLVPFTAVIILSNSSIFFIMLWGKWFFNEPVSLAAWMGAVLLLVGIVAVNWPKPNR